MKPLAGKLVLDFGQGVAGPYCGMLLADFGAEVIKIEPPRGDWSRSIGTQLTPTESAIYLSVNRNKRSLVLDLTKDEARDVVLQLMAKCDVVIESFRPGVMEKFGLGYEDLKLLRPDIIYCSVTGFGPDGPYAQLPAGDSTMQALGGLMSIIGEASGPEYRVGNVVSDMLSGMHAFEGVLLAIMERDQGRGGRKVEISLLNVIVAFQAPALTGYLATGDLPARSGNDHPMIAPSGAMRTSDGAVVLTVLDHQWADFCGHLSLENLIDDPLFHTNANRMKNRSALTEALEAVLRKRTTADWLVSFREDDILCAPINNYADLAADPQVVHNKIFGTLPHPLLGTVPHISSPIQVRGEVAASATTPPVLGQDTADILRTKLGLNEDDLRRLSASGATPQLKTGAERAER